MKLKKFFIYLLTFLVAIMLGTVLSTVLSSVSSLEWLTTSHTIGFDAISADLYVLDLTLGFHLKISVIQIILLILAFFTAPKVAGAFIKS